MNAKDMKAAFATGKPKCGRFVVGPIPMLPPQQAEQLQRLGLRSRRRGEPAPAPGGAARRPGCPSSSSGRGRHLTRRATTAVGGAISEGSDSAYGVDTWPRRACSGAAGSDPDQARRSSVRSRPVRIGKRAHFAAPVPRHAPGVGTPPGPSRPGARRHPAIELARTTRGKLRCRSGGRSGAKKKGAFLRARDTR